MRWLLTLLAGVLIASLFSLVDWEGLLPRAPKGLIAVLVPGCTLIALSSLLRARIALGVHRWSAVTMAAAATLGPAAWWLTSDRLAATAHIATGLLAYVAILMAAGRRPYDPSNRISGIVVVGAVIAGAVTLLGNNDAIAALEVRPLMTLVVSVLAVTAAASLAIAQGWWPSSGVALMLTGAVTLLGAQVAAIDGAVLQPVVPLELLALTLLLAGALIGDSGVPAPDRRRFASVVVGLAVAVAVAVEVLHGRGDGAGVVADASAALVLIATFGRAISTSGLAERTDPSELGGIDRLTGLPDRYELEAVLERELEYAGHHKMPVALAVLGLTNLHEINETLGHRVGDEVLREFAGRLSSHAGTDVPMRLAGNTFALILRSHRSESAARTALERLTERLEAPLQVDSVSLATQVRVGLVFFPVHGRTVAELLQRAEIASQEAKDRNMALVVYDPARDLRSRERLVFAGQLREGIERDELRVYFQPKVDLATGVVIGAEALVRWQHPVAGLLTPDRFLPVAARTGQMGPLTSWVLNAALREVQRWRAQGYALQVAVNLAPQNLVDTTLPARLGQLLERYGLLGSSLELEITEDTAMADPAHTAAVIRGISELGIGFSLDDFGTGYSSLAHLKYLNCNELKIDRSFVRDIASDEDDRVIVWSILDLARNLGMRTVAEGIESADVVRLLTMMGCGVGQGYHFARPIDADAFVAWCGVQQRDGKILLLDGTPA